MPPEQAEIDRAVALLQAGELVAFPTETVYGLGADAANPLPWPGSSPPRVDLPIIH
jgi:tRNA A37 threonylcarbamoyladenosine synthetase subunit TsaC/SUA5/YrdC